MPFFYDAINRLKEINRPDIGFIPKEAATHQAQVTAHHVVPTALREINGTFCFFKRTAGRVVGHHTGEAAAHSHAPHLREVKLFDVGAKALKHRSLEPDLLQCGTLDIGKLQAGNLPRRLAGQNRAVRSNGQKHTTPTM